MTEELDEVIDSLRDAAKTLPKGYELSISVPASEWEKLGAHKMFVGLHVGENLFIQPEYEGLYKALYEICKGGAYSWEKIAGTLNAIQEDNRRYSVRH